MIRRLTEAIKIPETVRIPLLGGWNYRLCNCIDNYSIKKEKIKKPLNTKHRDIYITASLTSYPARIQYVHLAIKSLMLQSCKPDRIILWLADSQFNNRQIPTTLSALEEYGLEIKWCDDLYGHKKYFW